MCESSFLETLVYFRLFMYSVSYIDLLVDHCVENNLKEKKQQRLINKSYNSGTAKNSDRNGLTA